MEFKNVTFLTSVASGKSIKHFGLDEIAVAGKSNVGKSSFINMLANKSIAKTSKLPGRTRLLNFFDFDKKFVLVDLPGYGFAKASKEEQAKWGELIESYILQSDELKHVLLLVDLRHNPTEGDKQMARFLMFHNISFSVIATKADKLPKSKLPNYKRIIASDLKIAIDNVYIVSNETKQGKDKIIERLFQFVGSNQ